MRYKLGYDVEIDVWSIDKQFYLGHDEPQYKIDKKFLQNKKVVVSRKKY